MYSRCTFTDRTMSSTCGLSSDHDARTAVAACSAEPGHTDHEGEGAHHEHGLLTLTGAGFAGAASSCADETFPTHQTHRDPAPPHGSWVEHHRPVGEAAVPVTDPVWSCDPNVPLGCPTERSRVPSHGNDAHRPTPDPKISMTEPKLETAMWPGPVTLAAGRHRSSDEHHKRHIDRLRKKRRPHHREHDGTDNPEHPAHPAEHRVETARLHRDHDDDSGTTHRAACTDDGPCGDQYLALFAHPPRFSSL